MLVGGLRYPKKHVLSTQSVLGARNEVIKVAIMTNFELFLSFFAYFHEIKHQESCSRCLKWLIPVRIHPTHINFRDICDFNEENMILRPIFYQNLPKSLALVKASSF